MNRSTHQELSLTILLAIALQLASLASACSLPQQGSPTAPNFQSPTAGHQIITRTPFQPLPEGPAAGATLQALSGDWPSAPLNTATGLLSATPLTLFDTETPKATATNIPTYTDSPTSPSITLWVDPQLPAALQAGLNLPSDLERSQTRQTASLYLEVGSERQISRWVYALVTPFPTIVDSVTFESLLAAWRGQPSGPFAGKALLVDESTLAVFNALWGAPASGATQVLPTGDLLEQAWRDKPSWAIVPFETLEPAWKVLQISGVSPLQMGFDASSYPLSVPVSLGGQAGLVEAYLLENGQGLVPTGNRNPDKMTTLVMTGVTALVRATAYAMEQKGINYPGKDIGDWLRQADLTHISNEVPFAKDCPYPNPVQASMRFCSDPRYIGLLESVGTDIIELTGDHFQDWGQAATLFTLELYKSEDWPYYGGGANLDEARRALLIEHNGNRLAFIGCNAKGGSFAQASASRPGAVSCDFPWMEKEIARLRAEGYLPIVTFQHFEYYTYQAQPNQQRDSRRLAEAGALIVSGSQAHQPQGFEFTESGALIHYGLGNLFFDQYDVSRATRQGFIDRHIFYDGRHISTELLTIIFVDYARARPMTNDERRVLLEAVFAASNW